MERAEAAFTVRVLYADTDMAGVVYHANYLRFFEAARTHFMTAAGLDPAHLQAQLGIVFAVTELTMGFHDSARYGDMLRIFVEPTKVGPARFTLSYRVLRPEAAAPCVTGTTVLCALHGESGKVVRLPAELRAWLTAQMAPTDVADPARRCHNAQDTELSTDAG